HFNKKSRGLFRGCYTKKCWILFARNCWKIISIFCRKVLAVYTDIQGKLVISVIETKTRDMIDKCIELTAYEAQYRMPWIVFDRDQVKDFDAIIREAKEKEIGVGWSNPCFEIWLYAYFGSMPTLHESWTCCSEFGKVYENRTGQKYSKADSDMYSRICRNGDEEKAIRVAQQKLEQCIRDGKVKPSGMWPCTTVHELVGEIRRKIIS
ncbi:MAG: RloB family protein, partial [Lachnospiraceae bacterium]|nr:RloB family protein [Lachnospiraceae bacterium]MDD3617645.1 RloB family protein [Lachnospiraceae bacterium]